MLMSRHTTCYLSRHQDQAARIALGVRRLFLVHNGGGNTWLSRANRTQDMKHAPLAICHGERQNHDGFSCRSPETEGA